MSERVPHILVADMLEAIECIESFTRGMTYGEFIADRKTAHAVLRDLHVLGEAARQIPEHVREIAPEIEWQRIIRSRHIVVHDYFDVDYEIVWRIVEAHLPPLHESLRKLQMQLPDKTE